MPTVAVLGTGIMGAPMARNLAAAGLEVRVWNRTPDKAAALADVATVARSPGEATLGADLLVTMLADGPAVEAVVGDASDPLGELGDGVWIQMSTVGDDWIGRLHQVADDHDVAFVDAPVLGTKGPAEAGALTVVAAGDGALRERCAPVFDAVGAKTVWVGQVGAASRLKLVLNTWVVALVTALAESVALAEALGLQPQQFLDIIDGGPLGPAYANIKGGAMVARDYPAAFPLRLALKDARLVQDAAEKAGVDLAVVRGVIEQMARAADGGHGDEDMAAVAEAVRP